MTSGVAPFTEPGGARRTGDRGDACPSNIQQDPLLNSYITANQVTRPFYIIAL